MLRRASILASVVAMLTTSACEKKPTYDDAPIARGDRTKKSAEPPETFDDEAICAQLVDLPGGVIETSLKPDLRAMCRKGLKSVQTDHPAEYACRCHCIQAAGDIFAVERCTRFCSAEDVQRVCDHVVGVENDTNDGGVLDSAHDDCVAALKKLHEGDVARWSCTVRCLVAATAKDDALACNAKCGAATPKSDAGVDTGVAVPPPPPAKYPKEIE
jgi:hypothetical protein